MSYKKSCDTQNYRTTDYIICHNKNISWLDYIIMPYNKSCYNMGGSGGERPRSRPQAATRIEVLTHLDYKKKNEIDMPLPQGL